MTRDWYVGSYAGRPDSHLAPDGRPVGGANSSYYGQGVRDPDLHPPRKVRADMAAFAEYNAGVDRAVAANRFRPSHKKKATS